MSQIEQTRGGAEAIKSHVQAAASNIDKLKERQEETSISACWAQANETLGTTLHRLNGMRVPLNRAEGKTPAIDSASDHISNAFTMATEQGINVSDAPVSRAITHGLVELGGIITEVQLRHARNYHHKRRLGELLMQLDSVVAEIGDVAAHYIHNEQGIEANRRAFGATSDQVIAACDQFGSAL